MRRLRVYGNVLLTSARVRTCSSSLDVEQLADGVSACMSPPCSEAQLLAGALRFSSSPFLLLLNARMRSVPQAGSLQTDLGPCALCFCADI